MDKDKMKHEGQRIGFLVAAGMSAYVLIISTLCYLKFHTYSYTDFDLAVHAQSIWNILHESMDSSILGIPFLGNHMVLILYLVTPLYAPWSNPLLLLYLQTAVLSLGVPLVLYWKSTNTDHRNFDVDLTISDGDTLYSGEALAR
jgi:uncharacterized membrane protein